MPLRITDSQRKAVLALLAQGLARETVAAQVGITPGQVSAVAAHLKMGTKVAFTNTATKMVFQAGNDKSAVS